jgi:hypothetical protein
VAAAIAEAVRFGGLAAGLDVTFVDPATPAHRAVTGAGLALELPPPAPSSGPEMDPARPPRLRG